MMAGRFVSAHRRPIANKNNVTFEDVSEWMVGEQRHRAREVQ